MLGSERISIYICRLDEKTNVKMAVAIGKCSIGKGFPVPRRAGLPHRVFRKISGISRVPRSSSSGVELTVVMSHHTGSKLKRLALLTDSLDESNSILIEIVPVSVCLSVCLSVSWFRWLEAKSRTGTR